MKTVWVLVLPFFILSCDTTLALVRASAQGDLNAVQALVSNGAELNTWAVVEHKGAEDRDLNGKTPLLAAACAHQFHVVQYLIRSGADVNFRHGGSKVPLLAAAVQGECFNSPIISALLRAGADPNQTDLYGRTPLFYATNTLALKLLIEGGASLGARDSDRATALDYAARRGDNEGFSYLVSAGIINVLSEDEVLRYYCRIIDDKRNGPPMAMIFAKNLQEPEKKYCKTIWDVESFSVLKYAAERQEIQILDILLSRMAQPSREIAFQCDDSNESLIVIAARKGNVKMINLLHKYGADVNQQCHSPAPNDSIPMVRTPIQEAVWLKHVKAAQLLIDLGANISYSATRNHLLSDLASNGDIEDLDRIIATMKLLLKHGARIDERDSEGRTPLMHAAMIGHPQMARFLLANKANFKLEDNNGWTPMMHAEAKNHVEFIRALRDAGAKK